MSLTPYTSHIFRCMSFALQKIFFSHWSLIPTARKCFPTFNACWSPGTCLRLLAWTPFLWERLEDMDIFRDVWYHHRTSAAGYNEYLLTVFKCRMQFIFEMRTGLRLDLQYIRRSCLPYVWITLESAGRPYNNISFFKNRRVFDSKQTIVRLSSKTRPFTWCSTQQQPSICRCESQVTRHSKNQLWFTRIPCVTWNGIIFTTLSVGGFLHLAWCAG